MTTNHTPDNCIFSWSNEEQVLCVESVWALLYLTEATGAQGHSLEKHSHRVCSSGERAVHCSLDPVFVMNPPGVSVDSLLITYTNPVHTYSRLEACLQSGLQI